MKITTNFAPIALFVYNRLENTQQTVQHLQQNLYADQSELYIFSDGGKDVASMLQVEQMRRYLQTIKGFKQVHIKERPTNYYLERNIIEGIRQVFSKHDRIIVVEDDLCTSPYFLSYMNQSLTLYAAHPQVMHISGFTHLALADKGTTYFTPHMGGWGWGTWRDRWEQFVHYASRAEALEGLSAADQSAIEYEGSFPCLRSLDATPIPWDICWEIQIYKQKGLCLTPTNTLVRNIGLYQGTHFKLSKWIGSYTYDRAVWPHPITVEKCTIAKDPTIEALYPAAFHNFGIRYTLLGGLLRWGYRKILKRK